MQTGGIRLTPEEFLRAQECAKKQDEREKKKLLKKELKLKNKKKKNKAPRVRELDEDGEEIPPLGSSSSGGEEDDVSSDASSLDEEAKRKKQEEEDARPWSKANTQEMVEIMERLKDGPDMSFAKDLEVDPESPEKENLKPVTWTQLRTCIGYERQSKGFMLTGDISQKCTEHWDRAKQIWVRDADGVEATAIFYMLDGEKVFDFDDIQVGNRIQFRNPKYHRFMDGNEGLRLDDLDQIIKVEKRRFTDKSKIDYGELHKKNGTKKYEKKQYDDAITLYEKAITHLEGTFHENPEDESRAKEIIASCHLNIAACQIQQGRWSVIEIPCRKALATNASKKLNAKAYYRMGQASIKGASYRSAVDYLNRARDLLKPEEDPLVLQELNKALDCLTEEREAQKELFDIKRQKDAQRAADAEAAERAGGQKSRFGLKKSLFSDVPTSLDGVHNFRDIGGLLVVRNEEGAVNTGEEGEQATAKATTTTTTYLRIKKNVLYRSGNLASITPASLHSLTDHLGIKTVIDLRNGHEAASAASQRKSLVDTVNKGLRERRERRKQLFNSSSAKKKKKAKASDDDSSSSSSSDDENGDETKKKKKNVSNTKTTKLPKKPLSYVDYRETFIPVQVNCRGVVAVPSNPSSQQQQTIYKRTLSIPKAKSQEGGQSALLEGPVSFQIDLITKSVYSLMSWWVMFQALFLGLLMQIRWASNVVVQGTAIRVGVEEFYRTVVKKQGPEIAEVIRMVADASNYPILISCTFGKDRTGICVAMLLSALGVADTDVAQEYAKTHLDATLIDKMKEIGFTDKKWQSAEPPTLLGLLQWVKKEYGSTEKYLLTMGVAASDLERLRSALLVPVQVKK